MLEGLDLLKNRGREACGLTDGSIVLLASSLPELKKQKANLKENLLAHNLHAMVDCIAQPLKGKGVLVANCEIYNWKELAEKKKLKAKNDADLLLKLFDKEGVSEKTLDQLEGVYAFAYLKNNSLTLARDMLGVKPMWYSATSGFSFASEKKVLKNS